MLAVDLFAGAGGWSVALRRLGVEVVGIDTDPTAVATQHAAQHCGAVCGDVRDHGPAAYPATILVASPPCQTFSLAGKGSGRANLAAVLRAVHQLQDGPGRVLDVQDERTALVLEPLRWALDAAALGRPYEVIALEQVPAVLPVWRAVGIVLDSIGYGVDVGYVHAEALGVPQTRKRAVLVATLGREAALPNPTHSRYHVRTPDRLDPGVAPWVSMADALGWGADEHVLSTYSTHSDYGRRGVRHAGQPAATVTTHVDRNLRLATPFHTRAYDRSTPRTLDRPAPTIAMGHASGEYRWIPQDVDGRPRVRDQSGTPIDLTWPARRPATVVAGRDLVQHPGETANRFNDSTKTRNDGLRVTVAEAGVLQGFPPDYPWQGKRGDQYRQVGNAIPPPMAEAILRAALLPAKPRGEPMDTRPLVVVVDAAPAPQGSKRHVGGGILIESSRNVKPFREAVARAATTEALKRGPGMSAPVFPGAVLVSLTFTLPRPATHYRKRIKGGQVIAKILREDAPAYPAKKPDLDKLTRAVLDALTTAAVYPDDALVIALDAEKSYPGMAMDALDDPGVVITVRAAP